jgi:hypothetical protein
MTFSKTELNRLSHATSQLNNTQIDIPPEFMHLLLMVNTFPECRWLDALSKSQIASKQWIVDQLNEIQLDRAIGNVVVVGGWYGILPYMMFNQLETTKRICSIDLDETVHQPAREFNRKNWSPYQSPHLCRFQSIQYNAYDINWKEDRSMVIPMDTEQYVLFPNTIINTICEHLPDIPAWMNTIPNNKLVVLQSNNKYDEPDHINCSPSLEHFAEQVEWKFRTTLFKQSQPMGSYDRYMIIGITNDTTQTNHTDTDINSQPQ